MIIILLLLSIV